VNAMGKAPAPYAKENEDWTLPTYACRDKHGYFPIDVSYRERLTVDATQEAFKEDAQKKLMAAQASGDFQAMAALTQQLQAQAMQQAMANQNNTPITVNVYTNDGSSETIDPDSVFADGVGFIAIKAARGGASSGKEQIDFYFDPAELKDAQRIARFDLSGNLRVPDMLALTSIRIKISGPTAPVEALAKQLKTGEVLKRLTEKRTKVER